MGLFTNKAQAGKDYCVFCGHGIVNGKCEKCGREAKEMVDFDRFAFRPVPAEAAEALGEQKKKLFGNPKYDVQEMIKTGRLYMADILFDSIIEDEQDVGGEDEERIQYSYYVQFSTPEGEPCKMRCEATFGDYSAVDRNMRKGKREGFLLKGTKKNKDYYYAYLPEDDDIGKMLRLGLAKAMMEKGRDYLNRRMPPEGGDSPGHKTFELTWEEAANGEGNA